MNEELIRYRQKKARDTLEDAALLFQSRRLFSTGQVMFPQRLPDLSR